MRRIVFLLALLLAIAVPATPLASGDPTYVDVLEPAGAPRGIVIGVHGGAWYGVGRVLALETRPDLQRWRRAGWLGLIVDYPPGGPAVDSVLAAYDRVQARNRGRLPVCLYGESAGAQLALLVAERRPDVACVETAGAPTDLEAIDPRPSALAAHADRNARRAFPGRALRDASPLAHAGDVHGRLLLTHLRTDPVIGVRHSERMAAAVPGARLLVLEPGRLGWVHGAISRASAARLATAEAELRTTVLGDYPAAVARGVAGPPPASARRSRRRA